MKKSILTILITLLSATYSFSQQTIYDYTVETLEGDTISLSKFKGKKVMIVNTASKCGLTPQYEQLEELYKKYGGDNFVILGFPANNFMKQEPGTNSEIASFCQKNYGVTFPMMSKISVKGSDMHPLYVFLTSKKLNGKEDNEVQWNFQKYLINEKGELIKVISPRTSPTDTEIIKWIEGKS